ncbi:hypothetical protein DPMN_112857 [Dreissena polymorpha]|uniref:Uncharacterized protein n=1 Tax=Dreissena polymorpha TaxID=45954 RepID=A0A9D4KHM1_DREPO|nr:hypothetical protein DPMN_112857 [Dreissena polymorpha]
MTEANNVINPSTSDQAYTHHPLNQAPYAFRMNARMQPSRDSLNCSFRSSGMKSGKIRSKREIANDIDIDGIFFTHTFDLLGNIMFHDEYFRLVTTKRACEMVLHDDIVTDTISIEEFLQFRYDLTAVDEVILLKDRLVIHPSLREVLDGLPTEKSNSNIHNCHS